MMKRPSPSAPTNAAMVAVATTCTAAVRTPALSSGAATGSSTRRGTSTAVMPIQRAASLRSPGPWATATKEVVTDGGPASPAGDRNVVNATEDAKTGGQGQSGD